MYADAAGGIMKPQVVHLNTPPIAGLDRLDSYCKAKHLRNLSIEIVRGLIGEYALDRGVSADEARAASFQDAADTLAPKAPAKHLDDPQHSVVVGSAAPSTKPAAESVLHPNPAAENERNFMELAIKEARKCVGEDGRAHPKVGAVVVKDGIVVASAHRGEMGKGDHAEYTALEKKLAEDSVAGATVYTTLEPCTTRKPPKIPCAERLILRKVKRVVIGMLDPNPAIRGNGMLSLRKHNIEVALFPSDLMAVLEELNRDFSSAHS
jgi:pyrimidine deaminase RibD-like protein